MAKPECTLTDESMPGNNVESRVVRMMSASVKRGSLKKLGHVVEVEVNGKINELTIQRYSFPDETQ